MNSYRFDVISLFPYIFDSLKNLGVIGRALSANLAELHVHNPRDFTTDSYKKVDDVPYGGGAGMVLKPEPIFSAIESIPSRDQKRVLMMTPQGKRLSQADLYRWSKNYNQLIFICGNYEGFDERIRTLADEEISIGDFVLTGGELPAMTILNGVLRLIPGTLGSPSSLNEESHSDLLLEHPHYTRPASFRDMKVPDVLLSGNHHEIAKWRKDQSKILTKAKRPDIFSKWMIQKDSLPKERTSSRSIDKKANLNKIYEDDDHIWL